VHAYPGIGTATQCALLSVQRTVDAYSHSH